ncbi:hypothetical protein HUJ04_001381 [Dendroctonus ponderosae]|nr:hypothetical protein HUJ04_001381 [Dendroctonus ponderosae]KAH1024089.1 hypothetical protein HUJ05_003646 [Dendroctonus ponderosae]
MHANVHADRNSWRLPPDETLQVADRKAKKAETKQVFHCTLYLILTPNIYGQRKIQVNYITKNK